MSSGIKLRRIAAVKAARYRYVVNCVISALFRDERVLLISLDPANDPYSAEIGNLRGRTFHPDHDKLPRDSGSFGANFDYVCWAPAIERRTATAAESSRLLARLNSELTMDPIAARQPLLVVIDGCEFLRDAAHAPHADEIRHALRRCVAAGQQAVVAGEQSWDSDWLESDDAFAVPPHDLANFLPSGELGTA